MNGHVHVRFWSRAGMATSRLRQRRQVMGMTPDREVCRVQNAETMLGIIRDRRAARKRKTLVTCRACHEAIHAGRPTRQAISA